MQSGYLPNDTEELSETRSGRTADAVRVPDGSAFQRLNSSGAHRCGLGDG